MATINHWNDFQHKHLNKGYTREELHAMYQKYKKQHKIERSPKRRDRLEGFVAKHKSKASPRQLKSLYKQKEACKQLNARLSPNSWNACQKKHSGKGLTKKQLHDKCK